MVRPWSVTALVVALAVAAPAAGARAQPFDPDAALLHYRTAEPDNAVSRLNERLTAREAELPYDDGHGYLKGLLKALDIPGSSQTLVFSKTSLQRDKITPRLPRAVYFIDDVYVGWCADGEHLEVSAADPALGAVFYTAAQRAGRAARLTREIDNCTFCHASRANHQGVPGHLVRSVSTRGDGCRTSACSGSSTTPRRSAPGGAGGT